MALKSYSKVSFIGIGEEYVKSTLAESLDPPPIPVCQYDPQDTLSMTKLVVVEGGAAVTVNKIEFVGGCPELTILIGYCVGLATSAAVRTMATLLGAK
jgi:hypothetical protein